MSDQKTKEPANEGWREHMPKPDEGKATLGEGAHVVRTGNTNKGGAAMAQQTPKRRFGVGTVATHEQAVRADEEEMEGLEAYIGSTGEYADTGLSEEVAGWTAKRYTAPGRRSYISEGVTIADQMLGKLLEGEIRTDKEVKEALKARARAKARGIFAATAAEVIPEHRGEIRALLGDLRFYGQVAFVAKGNDGKWVFSDEKAAGKRNGKAVHERFVLIDKRQAYAPTGSPEHTNWSGMLKGKWNAAGKAGFDHAMEEKKGLRDEAEVTLTEVMEKKTKGLVFMDIPRGSHTVADGTEIRDPNGSVLIRSDGEAVVLVKAVGPLSGPKMNSVINPWRQGPDEPPVRAIPLSVLAKIAEEGQAVEVNLRDFAPRERDPEYIKDAARFLGVLRRGVPWVLEYEERDREQGALKEKATCEAAEFFSENEPSGSTFVFFKREKGRPAAIITRKKKGGPIVLGFVPERHKAFFDGLSPEELGVKLAGVREAVLVGARYADADKSSDDKAEESSDAPATSAADATA